MRRDEQRIDELLDRGFTRFGEPFREQLASDLSRVRERLDPHVTRASTTRSTEAGPRPVRGWLVALAAVAIVVVFVSAALVWDVTSRTPSGAIVNSVDGSVFQVGSTVRTNGGTGAVLRLADGSRVEMRSQSELWLEWAADGVRIRLASGGIIVNAAKQRTGHLYVQTKDMTVSVVGTVFLVNADTQGSRVAVLEGEVHVRQGAVERTLLPGDQVVTNPSIRPRPLEEAIAWSRNAPALAALLQQTAIARPVSPQVPAAEQGTTFEVISIRLSLPVGGGGRGAGAGSGIRRRNPRPSGEPCGIDREPVVDGRRFDASETTVHALITWAYGLNCSPWRGSDYLSGGPEWVMDDGYEIQAGIPVGAPVYTTAQLRANGAPELQRMLQNLLTDRFKLVLRREQRDLPVYRLTVAPGGPKLRPRESDQPNAEPGVIPPLPHGLTVWRKSDTDCCRAVTVTPEIINGRKQGMAPLARALTFVLGRPVLERTGLTGEYNFSFRFEPQRPPNTPTGGGAPRPVSLPPPNTRSIFAAIEEDLGLRLEPSTEKLEVFVIDRVERPSAN